MTKRIEIVPAARGTAVVETYLDGRRTAMSEPLPVPAARLRGEASAGLGGEVVDHTHGRADAAASRQRALGRMVRGDFRP
jgi:hypothetical protein